VVAQSHPARRDARADLDHPGARAPPPEAPYRGARPALRRGVAATPRAQLAAGRLPANHITCLRRCPCFGGPEGFSLSAPADGRGPGRRRATAAAAARRPIRGASGPCRAALKTYRKSAQIRRQPGVRSQDLRERATEPVLMTGYSPWLRVATMVLRPLAGIRCRDIRFCQRACARNARISEQCGWTSPRYDDGSSSEGRWCSGEIFGTNQAGFARTVPDG
jgi:hypothetical protein